MDSTPTRSGQDPSTRPQLAQGGPGRAPDTSGEPTLAAGDGVVPSRVAGEAETLADAAPRTASALPAAGAPFAGYEIVELLGRGGMGAVYRARRPGSRMDVALKVLLGGERAGEEEIARFRREAQVVATLRHPGIVAVHDVGEDGGSPFYTMDLVAGPSLARRIRDEGPLAVRAAFELVRDLALALEHAHGHGIVHRDLKPANVLLADGNRPVLTDFGIARQLGATRLTRTGALLGTPAYMAPEQAEGEAPRIGPHTDVYSLGAILYEALTGHVPFEGDTELAILYLVLNREPPPPRSWRPDLPAEAELVCLKAMDKEIPRRYATAQELADDLDRFLRGEAVAARPLGRGERVARFLRRRRREAVAIALGLALALGAGGWGVVAWRRAADERARRERQERESAAERLRAAERKEACDQAYQAGMRLYSTRRFEEALARFEEAIAIDPRSEPAHLNRAQLLRDLGRHAPARDAYREAARLLPRSSTARHQLGSLLFEEGKYDEAVAAFAEAIALEPDHAMAWSNRGYAHLRAGRLEDALADLERAVELDPRYAEAHLRRGIVWREKGDLEKAQADHDRAIELAPELAENWYQRARLASLRGDATAAARDAREAIRRGMRAAEAHLVLAQALHARHELPAALAELEQALALDPDHGPSLVQAGYLLNDLGRPAQAVPLLERALARDPNDASAWTNLGNACLFLDRLPRAVECYDRAASLRPADAKALSNRAMAHHRLGKGEAARADAEAAIRADATFGAPHVVLGLVLAREGRHAEALDEYAAAERFDLAGFVDQVEAARAWSLAALGQLEAALAAAGRALTANPANPDGLRFRAESLVRLGRRAEALAAIEDWTAHRPEDGAAWFGRGWIRLDAGQAAGAADDFAAARALGYDPQRFSTLKRAQALAEAGRGEEGIAEIDAVLTAEPAHAAAHQAKGVVLLRLGRWPEADAALARFAELEPKSPQGPYNRACVAARAGRADDALRWLERAVELGYADRAALERDPDLAALRDDPRFRALAGRLPAGR